MALEGLKVKKEVWLEVKPSESSTEKSRVMPGADLISKQTLCVRLWMQHTVKWIV